MAVNYINLKLFFYALVISSAVSLKTELFDNILPTHYSINIDIKNRSTFAGEVFVDIKVKTRSDRVILNARELEIENVNLESENLDERFEPSGFVIDRSSDLLTVTFPDQLLGNYRLHIKYTGSIGGSESGVHYFAYNSEKFGTKKSIVYTHLRPTYARTVFPCWDEPEFKSTFNISIKHDAKYTALSNMPIYKTEISEGNSAIWSFFDKTPVMSTYLLAFAVGDFDYVANDDKSVNIWFRKDKFDNKRNFINYEIEALRLLENYTGIGYKDQGLKKMDIVAIPGFKFSGMENWGLIFMNEYSLLFADNHFTYYQSHEKVVARIVNELAHQWFGNLVTPKFWRNMWLSEGISSYFDGIITNKINREWRTLDRITAMERTVMTSEGSKNITLNSDLELTDKKHGLGFQVLVGKASAIVRTINHTLGEEKFKNALRNYLEHNKFGSVVPKDLFDEFVKEAKDSDKEPLRKALNNWVNTPGYPVITVTRNYTTNRATITQKRFSVDKSVNLTDRYWVAINCATEDDLDFENTSVTYWFDPDLESIEIPAPGRDKWMVCNKQQMGYYRVNYDEDNWRMLLDYLKTLDFGKIHRINRAQLREDALYLAKYGYLNQTIATEFSHVSVNQLALLYIDMKKKSGGNL